MEHLPASALAVATTVHLCLAALRNHRQPSRGISPLALLSFAFAAAPWLFPSVAGLLIGFTLHVAWFVACERLAPPSAATAARQPAPVATAAAPALASRTPVRPRGFVSAPVIVTFDETPDIRTIRLLRPEGFDFEAGQFLTVRVRADGREHVRCYSISSAPATHGYLEISVKRQGLISSALHATARPGGTLSVRAPAGAFTYPSGDDRPLVLIAAGVGITPLMSMLRHACAAEPTRPVTLVYGVRTEQDFAFRDELHALARRHPHVRMYFAASQGATQPHVYPGRIDDALLAAAAPAVAHVLACICGPGAMIDDTRSRLLARGMPAAQIRYERFEAAVAASTRTQADAATAVGRPAAHAAHALTCARSNRRVPTQPGQTILEAAETAGVEIAALCRAGVCGTCRLQVTSGDAHCESTVLDDEDRAAGFVLACVTTLQSDCTVNA